MTENERKNKKTYNSVTSSSTRSVGEKLCVKEPNTRQMVGLDVREKKVAMTPNDESQIQEENPPSRDGDSRMNEELPITPLKNEYTAFFEFC